MCARSEWRFCGGRFVADGSFAASLGWRSWMRRLGVMRGLAMVRLTSVYWRSTRRTSRCSSRHCASAIDGRVASSLRTSSYASLANLYFHGCNEYYMGSIVLASSPATAQYRTLRHTAYTCDTTQLACETVQNGCTDREASAEDERDADRGLHQPRLPTRLRKRAGDTNLDGHWVPGPRTSVPCPARVAGVLQFACA